MVTFTALVKILSLEKCYNTKDSWARQKFYPSKIVGYIVIKLHVEGI